MTTTRDHGSATIVDPARPRDHGSKKSLDDAAGECVGPLWGFFRRSRGSEGCEGSWALTNPGRASRNGVATAIW